MPVINKSIELKKLKSQIKHLKNELALTKEENETAVLNYYDLYKNMEKLVKDRTQKLKNAMKTIYKYNHKLEEILQERTKHLIKTERHAAFSLLSQGIVHNLKNPLTVISSTNQLLKMKRPKFDNSEVSGPLLNYIQYVDKSLDKIDMGTQQMTDMINALMAKSKSDTSEKVEVVDINELLKKEIDFLSADSIFKYKVDNKITFSKEALCIEILPGELAQIFQNLIRNALDAMYQKEGASIEITTGLTGDEIWFSVKDNGPGISKENQDKIFDPFFSTKPKADEQTNGAPTGTGLGLHMCMQIAENYNGRIELSSDEGKGAEFRVYFPKSETKSNAMMIN